MKEDLREQLEGGLIHDTLLQARTEAGVREVEAEVAEWRRRGDEFAAEHGRQPNSLERWRIRKETAGETVPDGWEDQMREGLLEIQRREDAGESFTEILESMRG